MVTENCNTLDKKNHIGEIHGIYKIVDVLDLSDNYGHKVYKGVCTKCGRVKISHYGGFTAPTAIAYHCNHLDAEGNYHRNIRWNNIRIRNIFNKLKSRCYNQNDKSFRWYGGKGIKVYDEWMKNPKKFEEWALKNGYSDELSIDRIDCNKDYCPENCRWVTLEDNAKYKSTTSLIKVNNEVHTGKDWAKKLSLGENLINTYIREYGAENTAEFIRRYIDNPSIKRKCRKSIYDAYMNS